MKILITGSRKWTDLRLIHETLLHEIKESDVIVHGGAKGVDSFADEWAQQHGIKTIIVRPVNPNDKMSYLHRNAEMIGMADKVIAFWDGESSGTKFTFQYARKRGMNVNFVPLLSPSQKAMEQSSRFNMQEKEA